MKFVTILLLSILSFSAFALNIELPSESYTATLKVSALANCNYSGIETSITETDAEIIVNAKVVEAGRAFCEEQSPVNENIKLRFGYGQIRSNKKIVIRSSDASVKIIGIDFF